MVEEARRCDQARSYVEILPLSSGYGDAKLSAGTLGDDKTLVMDKISPFSFPRRSFSRLEQSLLEDESWFQSSNGFQPYMSVTGSAREKMRSLSTPRQRVGLMDSLFDNYKKDGDKVSLWQARPTHKAAKAFALGHKI
ncbi:unnamed protein product [Arabidopsis lyrata]|nr:unnamed protein product [Arabidopsis lyrata]